MFSLTVRDSIMIAHSLPDPFFGPAQGKHGATFIVDATFYRSALGPHNVVVDIGRAQACLKEALAGLAYKDLDTLPEFQGVLTTTEFLCRHIHQKLAAMAREGALGPGGADLSLIRVELSETHLARAQFIGSLRPRERTAKP